MSNIPPLHTWHGRSYTAQYPASAANLMRMAKGKKPKYPLKHRLRFLLCLFKGHHLVTDRWHKMDETDWFDKGDYEIHLGCTRCPFIITLDPKEVPEMLRHVTAGER